MAFDENFETTHWDAKEVKRASANRASSSRSASQGASQNKRRKKKGFRIGFGMWLFLCSRHCLKRGKGHRRRAGQCVKAGVCPQRGKGMRS